MPKFSDKSIATLSSCDERLKELFLAVVEKYDCSVLSGHRSPEEQFVFFMQGRVFSNDKSGWEIKDPSKVITYKDGKLKKSRHNYLPSLAVDVVPYPIDWEDKDRMHDFALHVKETSDRLKITVKWGGDWKRFIDLPHWEVKK